MTDVGINVRAYDNASAVLNRVGGKLGILNKQGLAMGVAFAGITMATQAAMAAFQGLKQHVTQSIQAFYAFEKSMAEAATMLDIMEKDLIPGMSKEITTLSIAFGQSAVDLSRGLYQALSAGVDAGKAMKFMKASTELASAGLASVETTVDALTTVLNAYSMSVENVNYVSDIMMKTVELGKLRLEDLAGTLGYVAPIAAQAGVSFEEISAAMATLTKQGINAHMAARSLRQTIVNLIAPSEEGREAMITLGLAYDDLTLESRGLFGTLEMINVAAQGQVGILNQLIPNVRALSAVMGLTGAQSGMFADGLREIENAAGTTAEKLKDVTSTTEYAKRVAEEYGKAQERKFGEMAAPADVFWTKQVAGMKDVGFGKYFSKTVDEEINAIEDSIKNTEKTAMEHEGIDAFAASLNRLETEGRSQAILYERLTNRIREYKQDVADLNTQLEKTHATHDYSEALRYIPMALKEAIYTNNIFDESTRALVDSIRIQKGEIEKLNDANKQYSIIARSSSIETMKIQLDAMGKRGRLTRTQKKQLEDIRKEELKNRIASMENQQKIAQMQGGLSAEEKRLAIIKRGYAEEIYLINDAYASQVHSLERTIGYKNLLIEEHVIDQKTALDNSTLAWNIYYDLLLEDTKTWSEEMKSYFEAVQGYTIGEGLSTAQSAMRGLSQTQGWQANLPVNKFLSGLQGLDNGLSIVPQTGLYQLHQGESVTTKGATNAGGSNKVTVDLTGNLNVNITKTIGAGDDPEAWVAKKISNGVRRGLITTDIDTLYG